MICGTNLSSFPDKEDTSMGSIQGLVLIKSADMTIGTPYIHKIPLVYLFQYPLHHLEHIDCFGGTDSNVAPQ